MYWRKRLYVFIKWWRCCAQSISIRMTIHLIPELCGSQFQLNFYHIWYLVQSLHTETNHWWIGLVFIWFQAHQIKTNLNRIHTQTFQIVSNFCELLLCIVVIKSRTSIKTSLININVATQTKSREDIHTSVLCTQSFLIKLPNLTK